MAKIKAVYKSVISITEVTIVGPSAVYWFDDWTESDPAAGMEVDITGFDTDTNNGQFVIQTVDLTAPYSFTVLFTLQNPETHTATGHAQSATGVTCAIIPKPAKDQAIVKTHNSNGCIFTDKKRKPKKGRKTRTVRWNPILKTSVLAMNTAFLRRCTRDWKRTLSAGNRAAWNAWAAGATIWAVGGSVHTPNGFEAFVKFHRDNAYSAWNPYTIDGKYPYSGPILEPGNPFVAMPAPAVTAGPLYEPNYQELDFTNPDLTQDLYLLAQIALPHTPHSYPGSWFASWFEGTYWDPGDPDAFAYMFPDYPFYTPDKPGSVELACHLFSAADFGWGPPTFLTLTI